MENDEGIKLVKVGEGRYRLAWPAAVAVWDLHFEQIIEMWEDRETKPKETEALLINVLRRCPDFLDVYNSLGTIVWQDGRVIDALVYFDRAYALAGIAVPEDFTGRLSWSFAENRPYLRIMHNAALACLYRGETEKAKHILRRELQYNPADDQGARLLLEDAEAGRIAFTVEQRLEKMLGLHGRDLKIFRSIIQSADRQFFNGAENVEPFEMDADKIDAPFYAGLIFRHALKKKTVKPRWLEILARHAADLCRPLQGGGIPAYIFTIYRYLWERSRFTEDDARRLREMLFLRPPGNEWMSGVDDAFAVTELLLSDEFYPKNETIRLILLLLSYPELAGRVCRQVMSAVFNGRLLSKQGEGTLLKQILASSLPGPLSDDDFWEQLDEFQSAVYDNDHLDLDGSDDECAEAWLDDGDYGYDEWSGIPDRSQPDGLGPSAERRFLASDEDAERIYEDYLKLIESDYLPLIDSKAEPVVSEYDWSGFRRLRTPYLTPDVRRAAVVLLAEHDGVESVISRYRKPRGIVERKFHEIRHGVLDLLTDSTRKIDLQLLNESLNDLSDDVSPTVRLRAMNLKVQGTGEAVNRPRRRTQAAATKTSERRNSVVLRSAEPSDFKK